MRGNSNKEPANVSHRRTEALQWIPGEQMDKEKCLKTKAGTEDHEWAQITRDTEQTEASGAS